MKSEDKYFNEKTKNCYSCGSEKELIRVENAIAKTSGWDVPIKKGYACKSCLKDKKIIKMKLTKNVHLFGDENPEINEYMLDAIR